MEAIDGIDDETGNGWAYSAGYPYGSDPTPWVIFELTKKKNKMNSVALINGKKRTDHMLLTFKVA